MIKREPVAARLLLLTSLCIGLLLATGRPLHAAPLPQDDSTDCNGLIDAGMSLYQRSDFGGALEQFQAALDCCRVAGDQAGEGLVLIAIGAVYFAQGEYAEALVAYGDALSISREISDRITEGGILNALGNVYQAQRRYPEALRAYEEALAIHREVSNPAGEATALDNVGAAYYAQGRYAEALVAFEDALGIVRKLAARDWEGNLINSIGLVYYGQGRHAEALEAYEQALAIHRQVSNRPMEGVTLHNVGEVYRVQGRYAEALTAYEGALAIHRQVKNRVGEGNTLNGLGNVYQAQGRFDEALAAYEEALVIHREVRNRAGAGDALNGIGAVYQAQGRYAEALASCEEALTIHREVGTRTGEALALNNIGSIYDHQGRYAEALAVFEEALDITREVGHQAGEGTTLSNIGFVYGDQGRFAEALAAFEKALVLQQKVGNRPAEATAYNNIGGVVRAQGHYREALAAFEEALVICRQVGDRNGEATTLSNIGAIYAAQGRYGEALEAFEGARAIYSQVGNRLLVGGVLNNIGWVYQKQGRFEEALDAHEEALAISRDVGHRASEGEALVNIGMVHFNQGQYAEALVAFEQGLAIQREVGDRANEGTTFHNIGSAYLGQGRYGEALAALESALDIGHELGSRSSEATVLHAIGTLHADQGRFAEALAAYEEALANLRAAGNREGEAVALVNIGVVYNVQGRHQEALDRYQQAMEVVETVRATAGSEAGRATFSAQYAHLYTRAVALFHQLGRDEEAFHTSERGRARAFLDSLATGQVQLADTASADLYNQEAEAYAARLAAQDALAKASALDPPDPDLVAGLEAQLAQAEAAHAEVLAAIADHGDRLAQLVPGRGLQNILGVSDVQALLDAETALLAYYLLDEGTVAFLITPDRFQVFELPVSREELTNRVSHLRDLIGFRELADTRVAAQELYRLLFAPLADALDTPRLLIVPHGALHYLPFAALLDPEADQYLLQRYNLAVLPSASALRFIQENSRRSASSPLSEASPLVVGDPASGDFDATASLAAERAGFERLPYAEEEARTVAALFGVEPLLGVAATEGAVRAGASGAGLLHLAAHGYYNPVAPLSSLVALAPDEAYDGWLTVGEVYGMELSHTNLVVLSACQTQLGALSAGDELVGLTRAFFYAGTPTVVASLWNVNDAATSALMERFYVGLRAGFPKAEALRQAQLESMAEYPDPYYWAPFVLSGDAGELVGKLAGEQTDESVDRGRSLPWLWIIVGSGACATAAIAIFLWRRKAA